MTDPLAEDAPRREVDVLLVEDEALVRLDLAETLRHAGWRVLECATAGEAAELLRTNQPIDALVTDVRTPGPIDGIALAREARMRDPSLPILVVSAHLDERDAHAADVFLRKPISSAAVLSALERMLGRSGSKD